MQRSGRLFRMLSRIKILQITSLSLFPSNPMTQYQFYLENSSATCSTTYNVGTTATINSVSDSRTTDAYPMNAYAGGTITFSPSSGASPPTSTVTGNTPGPGGTFTFSPMVTGLTANTGTFALSQCPLTNSLFYIHYINQSFVSIYNGTEYDFASSQQVSKLQMSNRTIPVYLSTQRFQISWSYCTHRRF